MERIRSGATRISHCEYFWHRYFLCPCLYSSNLCRIVLYSDRSQAWDALHFGGPPRTSPQFAAQKDFARLLKRQPGIVLSDIDPVYLNALFPRSFVAAPIDGNHQYKWSYTWRYDRPQALALVEHGLEQSIPVYALFISQTEMVSKQSRLPMVPGYEWHILNNSPGKTTILKLGPVGFDEP